MRPLFRWNKRYMISSSSKTSVNMLTWIIYDSASWLSNTPNMTSTTSISSNLIGREKGKETIIELTRNHIIFPSFYCLRKIQIEDRNIYTRKPDLNFHLTQGLWQLHPFSCNSAGPSIYRRWYTHLQINENK